MKSIVHEYEQLFLSDDKINALVLLGHIYKCDDCEFYHIEPHSSWVAVEYIVYYGVFQNK